MNVEQILAALQAIVDEAKGEPMTDEQVERYEALEGKLKAAQRSEEIAKRHAAYNAPAVRPPVADTSTRNDEAQLEAAFRHYLRTGKENADLTQLRAQGEGVASEGGYLVPTTMRQKLVDRMKAFGGIAQDVETITTASGEAMSWPTIDDTANVGEIVKEGSTFTSGADMEFGEASLGAYEYMAGGAGAAPLRVSKTLLDDAAFDVEGLVSKKLGERIARIQAPHIVTGTGNGEPQGILTGRTGILIANDATGVTYDDLIHFIHSVDPAYRESGRCQWGFNDKSLEMLKKIKDSHGDPIWRPSTADMGTDAEGGSSGKLLGYRYRVDNSFPDFVANSKTVNWGVFGDLQEGYVRRQIKDVQILVNPYERMAYRQVTYSAWARMDAVQQNTAAYVALTGEAP